MASVLQAAASRMPVVTLVGPRQSGKTTLVRTVFPDHAYVSLERPDERAMALEDPIDFLDRFSGPVILDEVQRAPELLSYIQDRVDRDGQPGGFILTGSHHLLLMEGVSQTLAGRTEILELYPLSVAELLNRPPLDPDTLDALDIEGPAPELDLWDLLWRGLYPRIWDHDLPADRWLASWIRTYVERDLRQVLRVGDLDAFQRFLRLCAGQTAQVLNLSQLAADTGISQPTAKQWLSALRTGFVVATAPAHHANFRKRVRKRPRLHFLDSGIVCALLGIPDPDTLRTHPLRGPIFESYVFAELLKTFANRGRAAPLYFWRDTGGHEVDILVDLGTRLVPFEIKSGKTVASDMLDGLAWWTGLDANPNEGGVLVHGGTRAEKRRGFVIRPWWLR